MKIQGDRLYDHLAELSDEEFAHVYEMTKREACVTFDIMGYTVGYQDAWTGREASNAFVSPAQREYYDVGFHNGSRRRLVADRTAGAGITA